MTTVRSHVSSPPAGADEGSSTQDVVALVRRAAVGAGRDDLAARIDGLLGDLARTGVRVAVVGEFKQGKSSLVNAVVGAQICRVDDDLATEVPLAIRYAERPELVVRASDGEERAAAWDDLPSLQASVDLDVSALEVGVPRALLQSGLTLVDTPGAGGLLSRSAVATRASLARSDAVVFVSDASQELSAVELAMLETACADGQHVDLVLTKTDLYPSWRRIAELDGQHLSAAGLAVEILPVSAELRSAALESGDVALNEESGFPALVARLATVAAHAGALSQRRLGLHLLDVVLQLAAPLLAERQALAGAEHDSALEQSLSLALTRAEQLRTRSARWQVTLGDGITDLSSDVDHDLRARVRSLLHEAETRIESVDPGRIWPEFEPWLYTRVTEEIAASYELLQDRTFRLAEAVAEHFRLEADEAAPLDVAVPTVLQPATDRTASLKGVRPVTLGQLMSGVRGSYSGILMFGTLGQLAGIALTGPVSVAIGVAMGGTTLRAERKRQLAARRQQAKAAVRAYVDEIAFLAGKDSRDALRAVQRELRNTFETRAAEVLASAEQSRSAARAALAQDEQERAARLVEVEAAVSTLQQLAVAVRRLGGSMASPT